MKPQLFVVLAASVLLASAYALAPAAPQGPADARIEGLVKDVADAKARVEQLSAELKETRGMLESTQKYLDAQSKAAKAMADTLDESEKAGFTYGINPDSRHILLRGWREQLGQLQQGVPSLPAPRPDAKSPARKP